MTDFADVVNMTPTSIERWLGTEESRSVGMTRPGEHEAAGHDEGRRIVQIKRNRIADLTNEDVAHMRNVVGYVRRHLAQGGPAQAVKTSRWRYSLMSWGHDPLMD